MTMATLGLPKKATRVARTAEELSAPVHLPTVGSLNVNKVIERMNETTKKRFKEVWTLTTTFSADNMAISNPMPCPTKDAEQAVKSGIAVPLPKGTPVTSHYFSILEQKVIEGETRDRRRAIQWAKPFNEYCDLKGYKASVNLKHHSEYFERVRQQFGACYDLKAGFFQIMLPNARLFTFVDEEGNVFGLERLPMGISTAPELMQIITSTLAGDPIFCSAAFSSHALVDVWIDNILFSGSEEKVKRASAAFLKTVEDVGATLNLDECTECSRAVNFIGMTLNFEECSVDLAPKNRKKIEEMDFTAGNRMRIADIETATARLMYASSVLGVRLAKHYYAIKFLRRKLSELNRETAQRSDVVTIPASSLEAFRRWHAEVKGASARKLPSMGGRKRFTLWTDASLTGWGAVLIDESTQRVAIVAGRWSEEEAMQHINVLEAKAITLALERFEVIDNAIIQPKVDNTSVMGSLRKGMSNSADLSECIAKVDNITASKNIILLRPQYVKSADNLADYWSRLPAKEDDVSPKALQAARG